MTNPAVCGPPERKVERGFGLTRRGNHVGAHNFSFVSKPTPRHFLLFLPVMSRVVEQRGSVGVCDMSVEAV